MQGLGQVRLSLPLPPPYKLSSDVYTFIIVHTHTKNKSNLFIYLKSGSQMLTDLRGVVNSMYSFLYQITNKKP